MRLLNVFREIFLRIVWGKDGKKGPGDTISRSTGLPGGEILERPGIPDAGLTARKASGQDGHRKAAPQAVSEKAGSRTSRPSLPVKTGKTTAARKKLLLNVGIDFGTSFTKVVYRDIHAGRSSVLGFGGRNGGLPEFYIPSAVTFAGGKIYFAWGAGRQMEGDSIGITSFKICMACRAKSVLTGGGCRLALEVEGRPCFTVRNGAGDITVGPSDIAALYLAYVIGLVRERLTGRYGKEVELGLTWNMCAPIDHYEKEHILGEFRRSLFLGEKLAGRVKDGMGVDDALRMLSTEKSGWIQLPDESEITTFIVPETYAAVISYVNSRQAEEGLYVVVDVGSGTTDVSFFRLSLGPKKVIFYEARTGLIGVDDIARDIILHSLSGSDAGVEKGLEDTREIGAVRDTIALGSAEGNGSRIFLTGRQAYQVGVEKYDAILGENATRVFDHYKKTFAGAFKKEKSEGRWKEFSMFTIGGGCRIGRIRRSAEKKPWERVDNVFHKKLVFLDDLSIDKDAGKMTQAVDLPHDLVAVAYGLSFHTGEYPEFVLPRDVDPFTPSLPYREIKDYEDQ